MTALTPSQIRSLTCIIEICGESTNIFSLKAVSAAQNLGKSRIYKNMAALRKAGKIKNIGAQYEGTWELIDRTTPPALPAVEKKHDSKINGHKLKTLLVLLAAGEEWLDIATIKKRGGVAGRSTIYSLNFLVSIRYAERAEHHAPVFRAIKTEYGEPIERFPQGTTIEIKNGIRHIVLPPAYARGYVPS